MNLEKFHYFLQVILEEIKQVLDSKSADYAAKGNKLANFELQARIDGITPIEALRGNWLKHRSSIIQGLDELEIGKVRPEEWWKEKIIDSINNPEFLSGISTINSCYWDSNNVCIRIFIQRRYEN